MTPDMFYLLVCGVFLLALLYLAGLLIRYSRAESARAAALDRRCADFLIAFKNDRMV